MIRGEGPGSGRAESLKHRLFSIQGGGDGGLRHRGSHVPSADRSPVRSRSGSTGRRRCVALHVSSVLHILIIHLAFPTLLYPSITSSHPPFPAALSNIPLSVNPSMPFLLVLTSCIFPSSGTFHSEGPQGRCSTGKLRTLKLAFTSLPKFEC